MAGKFSLAPAQLPLACALSREPTPPQEAPSSSWIVEARGLWSQFVYSTS